MSFRFDSGMEGTEQGFNLSQNSRRTFRAALFFCGLVIFAASSVVAADPPEPPTKPVTIPFEVKRDHVMVPVTLNGTNRISMMLDTGYGMTMLRERFAKVADLRRTGRSVTIVGIAGDEEAKVYEGPEFGFGAALWQPRRVGAFPESSGDRTKRHDGILGSGFFRRYVVEIDPFARKLHLHEPAQFSAVGQGEELTLSFKGTTPVVSAVVRLPTGREVQATFEIDTGCDGALCIGKHFVKQHELDGAVGADGRRSGVGGQASVRESRFEQLRLGSFVVTKPSANLFLERDPADPPIAGHIGWELLKQFRVTFDYSRKRMFVARQ